MNKLIQKLSFITLALGVMAGIAHAQTDAGRVGIAANGNVQTVDARQNGNWSVGIDPSQNTVKVANTRKPFQRRIIVAPLGSGFQTEFLDIPAGKRLVIENVSAIVRCPPGMRMETNYFTYFDNGAGEGGIEAITFHRVPVIDQGLFGTTQIYAGQEKTLVFAEETIGTNHYKIGVQARLNDMPPTGPYTIQAQYTFTGYLEDLQAQ